jgi:sugar phosphate isomerase/epimerase
MTAPLPDSPRTPEDEAPSAGVADEGPSPSLAVGVVTDEVSEDLEEALSMCRDWDIDRVELRQGAEGRFPNFTDAELRRVEAAIREGGEVTAVSPGILKGTVADTERLDRELEEILPRTIEAARRLDCSRVIVFGVRRAEEPPSDARARVLRCFERAAETAADAGMTIAIENEPGFWIDDPERSARLVEAVDHPALTLNWDPANLHWGGQRPTRAGFEAVRPHLGNLHVKDYTPNDPDVPWRPVGEGVTPWGDILTWIVEDTDLAHVTLETHYTPRIEASRKSLTALRRLIADAEHPRS